MSLGAILELALQTAVVRKVCCDYWLPTNNLAEGGSPPAQDAAHAPLALLHQQVDFVRVGLSV